jgi:hypothetical protein
VAIRLGMCFSRLWAVVGIPRLMTRCRGGSGESMCLSLGNQEMVLTKVWSGGQNAVANCSPVTGPGV